MSLYSDYDDDPEELERERKLKDKYSQNAAWIPRFIGDAHRIKVPSGRHKNDLILPPRRKYLRTAQPVPSREELSVLGATSITSPYLMLWAKWCLLALLAGVGAYLAPIWWAKIAVVGLIVIIAVFLNLFWLVRVIDVHPTGININDRSILSAQPESFNSADIKSVRVKQRFGSLIWNRWLNIAYVVIEVETSGTNAAGLQKYKFLVNNPAGVQNLIDQIQRGADENQLASAQAEQDAAQTLRRQEGILLDIERVMRQLSGSSYGLWMVAQLDLYNREVISRQDCVEMLQDPANAPAIFREILLERFTAPAEPTDRPSPPRPRPNA